MGFHRNPPVSTHKAIVTGIKTLVGLGQQASGSASTSTVQLWQDETSEANSADFIIAVYLQGKIVLIPGTYLTPCITSGDLLTRMALVDKIWRLKDLLPEQENDEDWRDLTFVAVKPSKKNSFAMSVLNELNHSDGTSTPPYFPLSRKIFTRTMNLEENKKEFSSFKFTFTSHQGEFNREHSQIKVDTMHNIDLLEFREEWKNVKWLEKEPRKALKNR